MHDTPAAHDLVAVDLTVNGTPVTSMVDARTSLLDFLREELGLTGAKKGCDHGQCGSCTVLVGDRRINSCLQLVVAAGGQDVTTVEGLAAVPTGRRLQEAFVARDALQCGYCTPGQLCSAVGMLGEAAAGWPSAVAADPPGSLDPDDIRERMSGNLCRCGAYGNLVAAITEVAP